MAVPRLEIETRYAEQRKLSTSNRRLVNDRMAYLFVKRVTDIVGALAGLIFLAPLFFVLAVLIKRDDPNGPVIFKQVRIGKNGVPFQMYKFRSMVSNAEALLDDLLDRNETTGAMFKMRNDPRVTRIGHFIRRTSLDELPQLLNVLKGEMSLVGPRPPLPREVSQYSDFDYQRLLVRPGCTGLWQVSGRSNVGFEKMVQLDLRYIMSRSIALDTKIIIKTLAVPFNHKDAY